jgi:hypothetical protein
MIVTERVEVQSGVNRDVFAVEKGSDGRKVVMVVVVDKK